jgi:hypothetical protein
MAAAAGKAPETPWQALWLACQVPGYILATYNLASLVGLKLGYPTLPAASLA